MVLGLAALLGGGAALASAAGGKSETGKVKVAADPYESVRTPLLKWLSGQIGKPGETYQGEMVAPLSEQENKSFDFLRKYGENGYGDTFNQAKGEISKTLNNEYDPTTSPYYQAVKAQSAVNLQDTQKNIADNAAGGGRYWTGARLGEQSKAARDSELGLNTMLGGMSERERERRLSVIPQALGLADMEQKLPLQQATAYQTLGALPRQVQQALDSAKQNEWLRSQVEYPMQIANLAAGVQTPPTYQQQAPSTIQQLLTAGGQGLATALPFLMMSCWVASEIFGGWNHPKTESARYFVNNMAPEWFRSFYQKNGQRIAKFISDKPVLKIALRPMFEVFAVLGNIGRQQDQIGVL